MQSVAARGYAAGVAWSALNAAAGVALPFVMFVVFARFLAPAEVGLVVLATAIAEIVKAFGAPGLYEALLQQSADDRRAHEAASAALMLTGVALTGVHVGIILLLCGWLPGVATHWPALALLGLRILCDLASLQPQAALAQRLAHGRMAVRALIGNVGAGALGVVLALRGDPFAGLVAYLLAQSVLVFAATAYGAGGLARPRLHADRLRAMAREATAASVVRLVAAVNNSLDQIIVAACIGSARLGWFNLGKRVETTFITTAAAFSTNLFQPLFAAEPSAGRAAGIGRGLGVLAVLCGAPCAWLLTNAESVVRVAFGPPWIPAAPVAALLAVSGLIRALGSVHGALLSVSARNRPLMRVTTASAIGGIAAVVAGAPFGILAVAALLVLKNAAAVGWMAHLTHTDAPRPAALYLRAVAAPFALLVAASALTRTLCVAAGAPALATLAASGLVIAACAFVCLGRHVAIAQLWPRRRLAIAGGA